MGGRSRENSSAGEGTSDTPEVDHHLPSTSASPPPSGASVSNQGQTDSKITVEEESGIGSTNEERGWYIPRPALCRNSTTCTCQTARSIQTVSDWLSPTPSSNSSTQSGSSGSLLLTAANLAALRIEPVAGHRADHVDSASVASSTHFTVVNGMPHRKVKPLSNSCCRKHQLSAVVLTTCGLFMIGLLVAIYLIDQRARSIQRLI